MKSHWTPRYVVDRGRLVLSEMRNPTSPWLAEGAVDLLDHLLRPSDAGLEWGTGRSTVWFAKRLGHLTSVEHHNGWADKVRNMLQEEGLAEKVDYRLTSQEGAGSSPYVQVATAMPDESLDFCLIDGQHRAHCLEAVMPKLKNGGVLTIDNINWYLKAPRGTRSPSSLPPGKPFADEVWARCWPTLSTWRCRWFTNGVSDTAIYIKA